MPNEAVLSDAETATLPGELVTAAAQHISLLGHSCQPYCHNVAYEKAIDMSSGIAIIDSSGFGLLPSASGLTGRAHWLPGFLH